jgi:acetyl esterase/lipase
MKNTALPEVIPVWPNGIPRVEFGSQQEQETIIPQFSVAPFYNLKVVRNVVQPTLTAFLPDPSIANGTAVIVCPGGGFYFLNIDNEGTDAAKWLNTRGVAAFVLKYRLLQTPDSDEDFLQQLQHAAQTMERMKAHAPLGVMDGKQAMRVVREHASKWGINKERIGILGFSAGGVVTIGAATQYEADNRPDFAAPIYGPVWQDLDVPADASPLFIALAGDDRAFPDGNMPLYSAWKTAGHSVELHIYSKGGHGFGMAKQDLPSDHWIERFGEWLQVQGFLP